MPEPTNERVIVKDNDIVERQLSFDNTSLETSAVKDFDAKPTTQRELIAWYTYSWAADGWTAASSSVFMPLIMSTMGTLGGINGLDPTKPCMPGGLCYVNLGTALVSPSSYALYISAIAVLIQAVIYVQLAVVADHSSHGKLYMLLFGYAGAITVILWAVLTINEKQYWAAGILYVLGSVFYGCSYVFYASYIPKLARNHPNVTETTDPREKAAKLTVQTSRISAMGLGAGALGGFIQMGISIGVLFAMNQSLMGLQVATAVGGAWWAIFTLIPVFFLKPRTGPPLPKGETYLTYPWKRVGRTMRRIRHLSQLFKFLLMWFILSDGIYTILKVAVLLAQAVVHTPALTILIGSMCTLGVSTLSYIFWHWVEKRVHAKPKTMLIALGFLSSFLAVYVLIGFSPNVSGGFKHPNEFIGLAVYFGLTALPTLGYARSTFAELIPVGRENEMFSMFLLTQGGGGWIGPLVTGVIGDRTGNMRYCYIFILACIVIPVVGLCFVDVEKGKQEALASTKRDAMELGIEINADDSSA